MIVDDDQDPLLAVDVRRSEGADDAHAQEVAAVGGLIELALVREMPGVGGYAVITLGVDSLCDGSGCVGGVGNRLLDAVEADVEAAMQNGGGMVGREGVDVGGGAPAVHAGLVSRQERGGGGGGDGRGGSRDPVGLACAAPLAAACAAGNGSPAVTPVGEDDCWQQSSGPCA